MIKIDIKIFVSGILMFIGLLLNAQTDPPTQGCDANLEFNPTNQIDLWKPIRHIRLVIHIIQKDDGTGNFIQNNSLDKIHLNNLFNEVNKNFASIDTPWNYLSGFNKKNHLNKVNISFFVDTIFYHQNSELYNYKKKVGYYNAQKKDSVQDHSKAYDIAEESYVKYVEQNKQYPLKYKDSALNVFMFEQKGWAGRGIAEGLNSKRWLLVVGAYELALQNNYQSLGLVISHELGHNLGLPHPFEYQYCSDLEEKKIGQTNNLMDAWPNQAKALSPCQCKILYKSVSNPKSDLFSCVDLNKEEDIHNIIITKGEVININQTVIPNGNILIEKGGTLNVECHLLMQPKSKIIIYPGGHLILNGGQVGNAVRDNPWYGIIQEKNKRILGIFKQKTRSLFNVYNNGYFYGSSDGITKIKLDK